MVSGLNTFTFGLRLVKHYVVYLNGGELRKALVIRWPHFLDRQSLWGDFSVFDLCLIV